MLYNNNCFLFSGKFWRVTSRKFYAIKRQSDTVGKPSTIELDSDSDSDFEPPRPKIKKKTSTPPHGADMLSSIREDIKLIRQDIQQIYKVDRHTKLPVALYHQLHNTFKCRICHNAPIVPNVIFARCCKSIVGCQSCTDQWYREDGMNKPCPLCGTPRALPDTMRIHGLDEFLCAIEPLLNQSHPDSSQDNAAQD